VDEREDVISLQDYLTVLRRRKWLIVAATVLTVAAAVAVSLVQTPLYEAETEVVVEPVRRTQDVSLEQLLQPQNSMVETERLVVTSRPVATRAAETVGATDVSRLLDKVAVEAIRDTRAVRIRVTDPDPVLAASIADAFAEGYLDYRRDQAVDELLAAGANLEGRAGDLRQEIAAIDAQLDGEEPDEVLTVQRDALLAQLAQVLAQSSDFNDATQNVTGGGAILTPAEVPEAPVSPQPVRTGALALVFGLLLGVGLAFLRDHVDDVIRDEADFKRATGGRPVLGRIPTWKDPEGGQRLATVVEPNSIASESYRELSAGVRFLLLAHGDRRAAAGEGGPELGRSILVASGSAGDGKTSTAANLAVAAARVGLRTLLVDTDLRRAALAQRFGLGRTTGLSDLLLTGDQLRDHVVSVGVDNLRVLPAGKLPPNPHELLASPVMRALEREILERVDLVIYDSPAVLAVPDALELGRHVDLAIVVGRAGITGRRQLSAAIERLEQVGTDVAGSVLNDLDSKNDDYYYNYYYGQQGADAPTPEGGGGRGRRGAKKASKAAPAAAASAGRRSRSTENAPRSVVVGADSPGGSRWSRAASEPGEQTASGSADVTPSRNPSPVERSTSPTVDVDDAPLFGPRGR
jgi:polysaccharide biosynthesis transport protein